MNSFIIPNWHPLLVHFTIALAVTSSVFFILTKLVSRQAETFAIVAKWTLWSAAFVTVLTLLAGFAAFNSVAHDDVAHLVMKTHRLWALVAAAALFVVAIWSYRVKAVSSLLVAGSLVVAGLVGTTGYLGAELVYRHGLGVMRLPDSSGDGHNHAADGAAHDHGETTAQSGDHHNAEQSQDHEHADTDDHGDAEEVGDEHGHADESVNEHDHGDDDGEDCGVTGYSDTKDAALEFANSFQAALNDGDFDTVAGSFAADAVVFENGVREASLDSYLEHHLKPEMPMLKAASRKVLKQDVRSAGGLAIVTTASTLSIKSKGKQHDFHSVETLALQNVEGSWKVAHVHWSSRPIAK